MRPKRRNFLLATAAGLTAGQAWLKAGETVEKPGIGYGFSLYGMKQMALTDALRTCAEIGYDCVEVPTMADWPAAPEKLAAAQRAELRSCLTDNNLRLSALMENVTLLAEPEQHAKNLARLQAAGALGHDLSPGDTPIVETIMGGTPASWEETKGRLAERLVDWKKVAEQAQTIIAIKAHVAGAAHRPEHVRWLLDQVRSPWIKAAFDFSHFQLRGIALAEAWNTLAADTVFIHIKDSTGDLQKFQFLLPGEGSIDYVDYFTLLRDAKCHADVVVEVSGQLHNKPEYDPIAAAKKSYAPIAAAFENAGIQRSTLRKSKP